MGLMRAVHGARAAAAHKTFVKNVNKGSAIIHKTQLGASHPAAHKAGKKAKKAMDRAISSSKKAVSPMPKARKAVRPSWAGYK